MIINKYLWGIKMVKKTKFTNIIWSLILILTIIFVTAACESNKTTIDINSNTAIGLEYLEAYLGYSVDYGDCILVKYEYTNTKDEDSCFEWDYDINTYQDGIRLEHAYLGNTDVICDFKDYANNNLDTIIESGTTITICQVFKISNKYSDINFKVSNDFDTNPILVNTITPLELLSPLKTVNVWRKYCSIDNESRWYYAIKYYFTNTSDIPKSFDDTFYVSACAAKENSEIKIDLKVSTETVSEISLASGIDSNRLKNRQKIINPGESMDVYLQFYLDSDESDSYYDLEVDVIDLNTDSIVYSDYFSNF